jgi:hypothetical protein
MAFNNRSTWVNFVKKPYIDGTSKPIIVTSADASKTPLLTLGKTNSVGICLMLRQKQHT